MRNMKSFEEVSKSTYKKFTVPLYESYCFSNIFGTVKDLFGIEADKKLPIDTLEGLETSPNKVVFFLIDAFGWSFYDRYKSQSKFLGKVEEKGVVSKLTSQFPSTTTVHVTTALTGEAINEHGLYEWFYYEPVVEDVIVPFLFKEARKDGMQTLQDRNIDPSSFLPKESLFKNLKEHGVKTTVYQPERINQGAFTETMCKHAELKGYENYKELFEGLSKDLVKDNEKEYFYVYIPELDTVAHKEGDSSKEFQAAVKKLFKHLDSFYDNGKSKFANTMIMISADHGQIESDLSKKYYINEMIPDIDKYLVKNRNGDIMSPTGYARDLILHVKEEHLNFLKEHLIKELKDLAEVYTFDELAQIGFFHNPSKRLKERCGNLIILPRGNTNIWWYEKDVFEIIFKGVHGGANKKEMEIPLLAYLFH
ncbi:alkaline phosphatase family protein [Clostridium sp. 'White wine YQ']|uniref:alkaline phosphatase family protein n=1 Tax=Clostridium sp. 'White wine YQ' TaxID=3027474 RepID=UPI002365484E|nr:alkaline phosphatase family protein [Clostridium sp. 'White wine YQ']MDD7794282.1 alkaline phosphatase family protein [Clostridium sp. 'White wine YQ']